MALDTQISDATVNAQADALATLLNNGYLRLYSGTKPATADTALAGNTLLAELRFSATAAPAAVSGLLTFNAITADASADASGTVTFFRAFKSDGTTPIMDGTVGTATSNMIVATTTITAAQTVSCSSFTHDVRNATAGL
jgi:hypothetical protein